MQRRSYKERICDVDMGSFTPLVFTTFGGLSKSCETVYKRLASLIGDKRGESYTAQSSPGFDVGSASPW